MDVRGRRVLVVGLGSSGEAAANALYGLGADVKVTEGSTDPTIEERAGRLRGSGIDVETGDHTLGDTAFDLAVVSPGIPPSARIVKALRSAGVRLIGEIELAYWVMRQELVAITGTNGKTTTTSMTAAMLREGGRSALAAGNIGTPLIEAVTDQDSEADVVVAEVSSFQLATIERFRPHLAVILNIAEDHTDWHGSLEEYGRAKARIFENQTPDDVLVYNADDEIVTALIRRSVARKVGFSASGPVPAGMGVEDGAAVWRGNVIFAASDVPMAGAAGLEDALAAACAALEMGVEPAAVVRALKAFEPLPHRMQIVARANDVTYIDDSKATNPHATLAAVRGLRDVVLIAGGRSKGIDLTPLETTVPPVIAVVALGEASDELERVFAQRVPFERAATMDEAVERAQARSVSRGSVLLAPACASLDMYKSYAARGDDFARAVRRVLGRKVTEHGTEARSDGNA